MHLRQALPAPSALVLGIDTDGLNQGPPAGWTRPWVEAHAARGRIGARKGLGGPSPPNLLFFLKPCPLARNLTTFFSDDRFTN
jgi:hypothetical protein